MAYPYRVGLIMPSSNVTMGSGLPVLLGRHPAISAHGVTFHSSRAVQHQADPESLRRMAAESECCARELADGRVDVVAYACLLATMAEGKGAHEAAAERLTKTVAAPIHRCR
jgi:maleate isomerase